MENKEVKKSYERLLSVGQEKYMEAVKRCNFQEAGKCGHCASCNLCPHYKMIKELYRAFRSAPLSDDGELLGSVGPIKAWTHYENAHKYLEGFDVALDSIDLTHSGVQ